MSRPQFFGLLAGIACAFIAAGWQVMTRHSAVSAVSPMDLALLRYWIPALVLAPVAWRLGLCPRSVRRPVLFVLVAGGGLPFGVLAMSGALFAPAAHMGVLVPGMAPFMAAVMAWRVSSEVPSRARAAGLAFMMVSALVLGSRSWADGAGTWQGDLLFLLAAFAWAAFTVALRESGLSPLQVAALVNAWSAILLLPWVAWHGVPSLSRLPVAELVAQGIWQGVLAGLGAFVLFALAVERLGPSPAAAVGAIVPVISATGGWWWLGERLSPAEWLAAAGVTTGVLLASGVLDRRKVRDRH